MAKLAFYSVLIVGVLLTIATIYLVAVNWSPRVFQPLLSVVFGGVVTAFITLSLILKQTTISERFPVYIVLDKRRDLPPSPWPGDWFSSFHSMSYRANTEQLGHNGSALRFDFSKPGPSFTKQREVDFKTREEKYKFYSELIQYELFHRIYGILRWDVGISAQTFPTKPAVVSLDLFEWKRPKRFAKIEGKRVIELLSRNQFLQDSERGFWEEKESWIPVPWKTAICVPDSQSVVLERPGYYRATIKIELIGAAPGSPAYLVEELGALPAETLGFKMTTEAVFEKYTAESPYSRETMDWIRSLFDRLKIEFSPRRKIQ